mmetsp:Transcript_43251/g.82532  ORF Transcript_43251/g.82532 Transcript_43251/m.82532 type:complete len:335 (-) Transcript_43251:874-1878(-)
MPTCHSASVVILGCLAWVMYMTGRKLYDHPRKHHETCKIKFHHCDPALTHVGLLLTKDDGRILKTWVRHMSVHFSGLVVLDGSIHTETSDMFVGCQGIHYHHEREFSALELFSDGELRQVGHQLVTKHFGHHVWITMAHSDEFYIHTPRNVIHAAVGERADFVRWRALHVLPHPSEYQEWLKAPNRDVFRMFRHYHHCGPSKGSFMESRTFHSQPGLLWTRNQGALLPGNLKKESTLHPSYLHYKVHNLSLSAYDKSGMHRQHWNKVSTNAYSSSRAKPGVGIRWNVSNARDFFVESWPNSAKYTHVSFFNGSIEPYLDIGFQYVTPIHGDCAI